MLERGVEPEEDIRREIMSQDVRDIEDSSYRNLRDWYIYRYIVQKLQGLVHIQVHSTENLGTRTDIFYTIKWTCCIVCI